MNEIWERIIFGLMGAVTAVVVGIAIYSDAPHYRGPASQSETTPISLESSYFFYFD